MIDNSDSERMGFFEALQAGCGTAGDRKNQYRFTGWCLGWAVTLVAATAFLTNNAESLGWAAWLVALAPFAVSIIALRAYLRFLREADEFIRKIQLEGLAIGFGAGILFTLGYDALTRVGAPAMSANDVVVVLAFGWMIGMTAATWRYR